MMVQDPSGSLFAELIRDAYHHHTVPVVQMTFVPVEISPIRADVLHVAQNTCPETVFVSGKIHTMLACDSAERFDHVISKSI
jgi:hypothetical protein